MEVWRSRSQFNSLMDYKCGRNIWCIIGWSKIIKLITMSGCWATWCWKAVKKINVAAEFFLKSVQISRSSCSCNKSWNVILLHNVRFLAYDVAPEFNCVLNMTNHGVLSRLFSATIFTHMWNGDKFYMSGCNLLLYRFIFTHSAHRHRLRSLRTVIKHIYLKILWARVQFICN